MDSGCELCDEFTELPHFLTKRLGGIPARVQLREIESFTQPGNLQGDVTKLLAHLLDAGSSEVFIKDVPDVTADSPLEFCSISLDPSLDGRSDLSGQRNEGFIHWGRHHRYTANAALGLPNAALGAFGIPGIPDAARQGTSPAGLRAWWVYHRGASGVAPQVPLETGRLVRREPVQGVAFAAKLGP